MPRLTSVTELPDQTLLATTAKLAERQRRATARLIAAIGEVDARRLYLQEGCSSMFTYCTRVLCLSEHAAYLRITAARISRRFPSVLERIADGSLTLTNARLLAPVLTDDNHEALLNAARHKSRYDVEQLVAGAKPRSEPETFTLQITVTREVRDQLRRAQNLLYHAVPDGDVGKIFGRALTALLRDTEARKVGSTGRPRRQVKMEPSSRHIPARVRREVWKRDQGQCAFIGAQGRCQERSGLEYHHVRPYARGGASTAANIELRCRAHNQYEAQQIFGGRVAERGRRGAPRQRGGRAAPK